MRRKFGFSLVELLVVMVIIVIVLSFIVPAVTSIVNSNQLSQGTQSLMGALSLTRQTAFTRNYPAVLRLYRYVDPSASGEQAPGRYRALQIFVKAGASGLVAVQKVVKLPQSVVINADSFSTILKDPQLSTRVDQSPSTSDPALPGIGNNYKYQDIIFNPGGTVQLSTAVTAPWSLTVEFARYPDTSPSTSPPPNFATITLNPINGAARLYRP